MDTFNIILMAVSGVCLVGYLMRRRSRLRLED
jgi:hypothetical protein